MSSLARLVSTCWLAATLAGVTACDDTLEPPAGGGCPPQGTVGLAPGQVVPNVESYDCTGAAVELRDLCPRRAAVVYTFAAW